VTGHYPEHLLRDYQLLLGYFPSHTACRPFVVEAMAKWKETYKPQGPVEILEIGPGYGETTLQILERIDASMTLIEADKTAALILGEALERAGKRAEVIVADAIEWIRTQASGSFDAFTSSWVVHNFPSAQREEFLIEVKRILRPGGLFVIFDKVLTDDASENDRVWNIHLQRMNGLKEIGRADLAESMIEHERRDAADPYVWHESQLLTTMTANGFANSTIVMRNERDIVFSALRQ
jgi:tRNA (cmo5U34)-methyltransferase